MSLFFVLLLFLSSFDYIKSKGLSEFCAYRGRDYEINKLESIFTIRDKVYIRVGTNYSKYWVYDIKLNQVLIQPVLASEKFKEHVAAVSCNKCHPKANNLLIAIGRKDLRSYKTFGTFRIQNDDSLVRIKDIRELPPNWKLKTDGEFSLDDVYWGFFPEDSVTLKLNGSNFHGFTYFAPKQIFILKYYVENKRYFIYKRINNDGSLTDWIDLKIVGDYNSLNSIFPINDTLYAINNDPQIMPLISSRIILEDNNGVLDVNSHNLNIEARRFFNCFDDPFTPSITIQSADTEKTSISSEATTKQSSITTSETTTETKATTSDTTVEMITSADISDSIELISDEDDEINLIWLLLLFLAGILCLVITLIVYLVFRGSKLKLRRKDHYNVSKASKANLTRFDSMNSTASMRSLDYNKHKPGVNLSQPNGSPSNASLRSFNEEGTKINIKLPQSKGSPSTVSFRSTNAN